MRTKTVLTKSLTLSADLFFFFAVFESACFGCAWCCTAQALTAAAQQKEERELRLRLEQEAEAHLRRQLREAEVLAKTLQDKFSQASERMDEEKSRLRAIANSKSLAAGLAENESEALRLRLAQKEASSAAVLAEAEKTEQRALAMEAAEREREKARQAKLRDAEAEKSVLRAQLAMVRSENATQNADRAQARMRRRLAEQRATEEREMERRAARDSRRRRLDNGAFSQLPHPHGPHFWPAHLQYAVCAV